MPENPSLNVRSKKMPMQVKEAVIRLEKNKNKKINLSERQRKSFRSEQSGQQHQKDLKDHRR